jgi:two-component system, NtrC family, response regulator GlrR
MRILAVECGHLHALGEQLTSILTQSMRQGFEVERLWVDGSSSAPDLALSVVRSQAEAVLLLLPVDPRQVHWLPALARRPFAVPLLAATEASDPQVLLELERLGIGEILAPPLTLASLLSRLSRLAVPTAVGRGEWPAADIPVGNGLCGLVGRSPAFLAQVAKIPMIARCNAGVLIRGETGTGKELVARAIHEARPSQRGPFVPVNCGAIPVELVENELFGHARSAYTGADLDRPGLVEDAAGGTLFLDEVDLLPALAQVKLLRFLQEKEFRRLGSTRTRKSDARVIAATNSDVARAVESGRLRRDLFYRLNVLPINLPPLRERRDDIPLLVHYYVTRYSRDLGRPEALLAPGVVEMLSAHDWPGNVRELEHVLYRALVLADGRPRLDRRDLLLSGEGTQPAGAARARASFRDAKAQMVARFEHDYLAEVLTAASGNISRAARLAKKNRRALFELIKKHHIDVERFRSSG